MPERKLRVELVRSSVDTEELISLGARLCYAGGDLDTLLSRISQNSQQAFVRKIIEMGHESVLEHASFTFLVEGVSRTLMAQITRHRIASFSIQSQRYVSYEKGFGYIIPPAIRALGEEAVEEYEEQMAQIQTWYVGWQQRLGATGEKSNEDARFVLPGACETRMLFTMNARELGHFFAMRMCERAQWEIRALATRMFEICYGEVPVLFEQAGPGCLRGTCPEGEKTCGQAREKREERAMFVSEQGLREE